MSIAIHFFSAPFTMMFDSVLSIVTGVGGCEWDISDRVFRMGVAFWEFLNYPPPYSSSMFDAITFIILFHSICPSTFYWDICFICMLDFGPREKYPPDMLHVSSSGI